MKRDCCASGSGKTERVCPECGRLYRERPAISRRDNATEICPDCGIREALATIGVFGEEADRVLAVLHRYCAQAPDT